MEQERKRLNLPCLASPSVAIWLSCFGTTPEIIHLKLVADTVYHHLTATFPAVKRPPTTSGSYTVA